MICVRPCSLLAGRACPAPTGLYWSNSFKTLLLCLALCLLPSCARWEVTETRPQNVEWPVYGGDQHSRQYSPLTRITRENVHRLERVWTYESAPEYELPDSSELQVNPLVVKGNLYGISPQYRVFALDAATGEKIWEFDPAEMIARISEAGSQGQMAMLLSHKRGLTWWEDGSDQRLFFSVGHFLMSLYALTGELVESIGRHGVIDLREGLGRPVESLGVAGNTPGIVFKNLLIMGTRVAEHQAAAPGDIRAYDVRTGEVRWTFRTIPRPGEPGSETWPEGAYQHFGGNNAWAGMSLDTERGLVFAPIGSPSEDFIGIHRHGANLYGNSLLALDAATGALRWHYQLVHHDLWDRDLNSAPTLIHVERDGEGIAAVAQTTKQGFVFVFDRETGAPLFPILEVPVPRSDVPGEEAWPTQPMPVAPPPFARQEFREEDLSRINPESFQQLQEQFEALIPSETFAPFGPEPRLMMPGYDGGATWGGPAFSPEHELLVVNSMDQPAIGQVAPIPGGASLGNILYQSVCAACHGVSREGVEGVGTALQDLASQYSQEELEDVIVNGRGRMVGVPVPEVALAILSEFLFQPLEPTTGESDTFVFGGYQRFRDAEGYPAIKPPWGVLTAIDLNRGELRWQSLLGEHEELSERGIPQTGTLNYGGPVVTASGLVFIAATMDSKVRAFDIRNGELLWTADLPAPAYSTPAVYAVDGRQYLALACGGGKLGSESSDAYVAFALPNE